MRSKLKIKFRDYLLVPFSQVWMFFEFPFFFYQSPSLISEYNTITRYHAISVQMGCRLPLDFKEAAVVEHFGVMGVCSVRAEAMACGRFG